MNERPNRDKEATLQLIIFCLNRPILCENLLRSIEKHVETLGETVTITVLYGATNEDYEEGFEILKERFRRLRVNYVRKTTGAYKTPYALLLHPRNAYYFSKYAYYRNTKQIFNFKELLEQIIAESKHDYVAFLTDDSFFRVPVAFDRRMFSLLRDSARQNSFSLRHGLNLANLPESMRCLETSISWDYSARENDGHWSYRFSIDGHIYDRLFLLKFIKNILYVNPNTFEGVVCRFAERKRVLRRGFGLRESALVGVELNRVQNVSANQNLGIDNLMLNSYYRRGFHLSLAIEDRVTRFHPRIVHLGLANATTGEQVTLA